MVQTGSLKENILRDPLSFFWVGGGGGTRFKPPFSSGNLQVATKNPGGIVMSIGMCQIGKPPKWGMVSLHPKRGTLNKKCSP